MTVYLNQSMQLPFSAIMNTYPANISVIAGNSAVSLILYDRQGVAFTFQIQAGQKLQQKNFGLFKFTLSGSGTAAIAISYPEVIDPSIEVTLNPNLPQSVTSPQLPSSLDSNGNFSIRHLGASDNPDTSVNQQYSFYEFQSEDTASFTISNSAANALEIEFTLQTGTLFRIDSIALYTDNCAGLVPSDDTGSGNSCINAAMDLFNFFLNSSAYTAAAQTDLGTARVLYPSASSSANPYTTGGALIAYLKYARHIFFNSSPSLTDPTPTFSGYVKFSQTNYTNMQLTIQGRVTGPAPTFTGTATTSSSSSTGGSGGGGGGGGIRVKV